MLLRFVFFSLLGAFCLTVGILDLYWASQGVDPGFYLPFGVFNTVGGVCWLYNAYKV